MISRMTIFARSVLCGLALWVGFASQARGAQLDKTQPGLNIQAASDEGTKAIRGFQLPEGYLCELVAAEPLFANPVSFAIDEKNRFYIAETFRFGKGVVDIRGHMDWLDAELASQSVAERLEYTRRFEPDNMAWYISHPDRVSMVWDADGDGVADHSSIFRGDFNHMADGIGSGLLARKGKVYYANIPHLWLLEDQDGDHVAESRTSLSYGYGVRYGFLGHDSHGLIVGPDGRLYFSIGDRGAHVETSDGRVVANHEMGAVYRCELDGSGLELFHVGLRNPQELAFDDFGNLWTVDNNSDAGDPARVVYVAEGGDSGWRIGWQFRETPMRRSSWLGERLCYEYFRDRAAYALPPVSSKVGNGPSGLLYDPGTGLDGTWSERFLLANFSGNPNSGIYGFSVESWGAGFVLKDNKKFWWNFLPTDVAMGYDGALYATDWVNGWSGLGKGRIYRLSHPEARNAKAAKEVQTWFAAGFETMTVPQLAGRLDHVDRRVRQEAQFALVDHKATDVLHRHVLYGGTLKGRLHAVWGLGQLARKGQDVRLSELMLSPYEEVRAQVAKIAGEAGLKSSVSGLKQLLSDASPRVRYAAAIALGHLGAREAMAEVLSMIRQNDDRDPWVRHAGVLALEGIQNEAGLKVLASDASPAVRLAAVVTLRRKASPQLSAFLGDEDPRVVAEAARAIHDLPVPEALPALAALDAKAGELATLPSGTATAPAPRDAILRRVVNAHFRLGSADGARTLAQLAARQDWPDWVRIEALGALATWNQPDGKDRVTGLWRPLPSRAPLKTGDLQASFKGILGASDGTSVKVSVLDTARAIGLKTLGADALALLKDLKQPSALRVASLNYLGDTRDPRLGEGVSLAGSDADSNLRGAASKFAGMVQSGAEAAAGLARVLASAALPERQSALSALALLQAPEADKVLKDWLGKLENNQVPAGLVLDLVEAARAREDGSIRQRLSAWEKKRPNAEENLDAWSECLEGGNAERGRKIFFEKLEVSCMRCHRLRGEGGEAGPDLSDVGARKDRRYILESMLFPNAQIAPGFETLIINLKNGIGHIGIMKEETADSLSLISPEDGLVKIRKADIQDRDKGLSGMPDIVRLVLSRGEIRDLVEFLSQQRQKP